MLIYRIFEVLFPIFLIIGLGYIYARHRSVDMQIANRLNMDVFTPALLFFVLSAKSFHIADYQILTLSGLWLTLFSGLLIVPLLPWLKVSARTFIPPMMFTNTGNMGLPVALFAFGQEGLQAAALLFVLSNVLHQSLGVSIVNARTHWLTCLRNPTLIATFLGIVVSGFQLTIPELLLKPIEMLGNISIPLMLFGLGVRLVEVNFKDWQIGIWGAVLCPISGIFAVALLLPWLVLPEKQFAVLWLYAVLPPAVMNYMVAEQYNQEPQRVASIVMLGNIASLLTLPTMLAFLPLLPTQ